MVTTYSILTSGNTTSVVRKGMVWRVWNMSVVSSNVLRTQKAKRTHSLCSQFTMTMLSDHSWPCSLLTVLCNHFWLVIWAASLVCVISVSMTREHLFFMYVHVAGHAPALHSSSCDQPLVQASGSACSCVLERNCYGLSTNGTSLGHFHRRENNFGHIGVWMHTYFVCCGDSTWRGVLYVSKI